MVGNTWHKAVTLILCIISAYLLLNRPSSTQESLQSPADHASHLHRDEEKTNIVGTTCVIPDLTDYEQFYSYFDKPKAACNHKEQVGGKRAGGGIKDGDKWVCFDNGFKPDDCVVYSFGINNEWSFDDAMDQKQHCQVFSFDPTMGAKDHQRSERISFFNLGISDYKGITMMRGKNCSMDRYSGIVEKLGHRSTVIDYLKMDIEGSELEFFKDVLDNNLELLDNIQQIGLEIHPRKPSTEISQRFRDFWEIFHRLECLGWRLINAEKNKVRSNHFNLSGTTRSNCYEVVWIKV